MITNIKIENTFSYKEIITIDKEQCHRSGAVLVKRHGLYGNFDGSKNFSINNCRYTRKFK